MKTSSWSSRVVRHLLQRTEIGQLLRRARAEKEVQPPSAARHRAPAPLGEGAERRRAGAGADHHDVGVRIVRHQEGRAEGPDDLHHVALLQVAEIVGGDAAEHAAVRPRLRHALDGEREVVGVRPLAVARRWQTE